MLNSYIVVDIETSGLYPECGDRILALSALKFEHEKLNDSYSCFVNTGIEIAPEIADIVGITSKDINLGIYPSIAFPCLLSLIGNFPILCHNVNFVKSFLDNEFSMLNLKPDLSFICTLELARKIFPNDSCTLKNLITRFDIQKKELNDAFRSDAQYISSIYKQLISI